jgi:hypothetical protein
MRHALLLSILLCPAAAAASSFQSFDAPGAAATCATAITSTGHVAGLAYGASATSATPFEFDGTHFTTPKLTLAPGIIIPSGLNRAGTLVGSVIYSGTVGAGTFEYRQRITTLTPQYTSLAAIDDNGAILAQISKASQAPLSPPYYVGVIRTKSGAVTTLDDGTGYLFPSGMDARADRAVGYSIGTSAFMAWSYKSGVFTPITIPNTISVRPTVIDNAGNIAGTYLTGTISNPITHGFFLRGATLTPYDVPNALSTQINGGNGSGAFTGCYTDSVGTHGFIVTP